MKKIIYLLLFIGFGAEAQGLSFLKNFAEKRKAVQEKRKQKRDDRWNSEHVYVSSVSGFALQSTVNENFAPNLYVGGLFTNNRSRILERGNKMHFFDANIGFGAVTLPESMAPTISLNSRMSYSLFFKLNDLIQVAPQLSVIANVRANTNNENNSIIMEGFTDLAPRVRIKKDFVFMGDPLSFDYDLAIPLVGLGFAAPTYNISFGEELPSGVFTVNRYQRIQSQFGLTLPPNRRFKNRRPRFAYSWDFLRFGLGGDRTLVNATHTLSLVGSLTTIK